MAILMDDQINLFPVIGEIVEQADKLVQRETKRTSGETNESHVDSEEKIVQEVDSLCMNCEEQVSKPFFSFQLITITNHRIK